MADQLHRLTAAAANAVGLPISDFGIIVDENGDITGEVRLGLGDNVLGGITISGVAGSPSGVTSLNGLTGAVASFGLNQLSNVDLTIAPTNGQGLIFDSASGTFKAGNIPRTFAGATDTDFVALANGHVAVYNSAVGKWVNVPQSSLVTSGGGTGSVQHPINTSGVYVLSNGLNMSSKAMTNIYSMAMTNGWRMLDTDVNSIVFEKTTGGVARPVWTLVHGGTVGEGFLALVDYGSLRDSRAGLKDYEIATPDNMLYMQSNGALRKTPLAQVGIGVFKNVDLTTAPTDGQVLIWDNASGTFKPGAQTGSAGAGTLGALSNVQANVDSLTAGEDDFVLSYDHASGNWGAQSLPALNVWDNLDLISGASPADQHVVYYDGTNWVVGLLDNPSLTELVTGSPTDGQGIQWDGNLSTYVFKDTLPTDLTAPAAGDIMYFDGTNWINLPVGSNGDVLTLVAGVPAWQAPA